jgi:ArsR family transcriptional regulator
MSLDPSAMLKAVAHPVRLGILQELAEQSEVCACDLGDAFSVSQPTISEHLRVLREAGLVTTRRDGNKICYSSDDGALEQLADVLQGLRPKVPTSA